MIQIARAKRSRPNIAYRQADLLEATGSGEYDLVLSVMTLHHVPDLRAALAHVKGLLAPGGRIVLADPYPAESALHPARRILHRLVPLRPRLQAMRSPASRREPRPARPGRRLGDLPAVHRQGVARSPRERPVLQPRGARAECCATLFPGCQLERLGGAVVGLTWKSPDQIS